MILRNRLKNPSVAMSVGLWFLVLGSGSRLFLHPNAVLSRNLVDGLTGLCYGVSIGSMLMSVWMRRKRRPAGPDS